jgi:tight adherence protein B
VAFAVRGKRDELPPEPSLRRARNVYDQAPAGTLSGRLDRAFDRLVLEAGVGLNGTAAFLLCVTSGLLLGGLVMLLRDDALGALWAGVLGFLLPIGYLMIQRLRRLRRIEDQLPEAVDMMARAVHAGGTVEDSIGLVADDLRGPLGDEFRWCHRQLELGLPVSSTMRGFSARVNLLSVRTLASTIAVYRQTGGNLATTMERLSEVARARLSFRRNVRATTGSGRLSAYLIAAAGPLAFAVLFFVHREHVQRLFQEPLGRMLLISGIILEIIGLVWLSRLMRIE